MNRRLASNSKRSRSGLMSGMTLAIILIWTVVPKASSATTQAKDSLSEMVASSVRKISREKTNAVVRIRCTDDHGEINATGFYVDPTGTVCTLAEIVRNAHEITILQDENVHQARILAIDPRSGVAFLKSSTPPEPGETSTFLTPHTVAVMPADTAVVAIGYPKDGKEAPSLGMITGNQTHVGEEYFCVPHMTASIPLSEGEGGAPVFNLTGELLGLVIAGDTQGGGCRILPASAIEKLHHDLLCYGRLNPGWVGAVVEEAAVPDHNSRTRIAAVEAGSPAESAGLLAGDTLVSLGSHSITNPEEVVAASFYLSAGDALRIGVSRGGQIHFIDLHCSEPPSSSMGSGDGPQTASVEKVLP